MTCSAILYSLFTLLLFQIAPDNLPKAEPQAVSPFVYDQRLIFLEMTVNGHRGLVFLLDTGASASAIDLKTAGKLRLPEKGVDKVEGTGGVISVETAFVENLSIGRAQAKDLIIPAYDLRSVPNPPGKQVAGILGYDFLRFFSVHIDFANRILTLYSRDAENASRKTSAVPVPFNIDNGIPRFKCLLNGAVPADFRLDTGASLFDTPDIYLNVTEDVWQRLKAVDPELKPERYFRGVGVGGAVKLPVSRIKGFSVNDIAVPSTFVIVQPKLGYFSRMDAVGFISNNFLEKFSPVTIDYLNSTLYLTKSSGNTSPPGRDRKGLKKH